MKDYTIVIPTYRRPERLLTHTIPMLINGGIAPTRIHVYAGDPENYTLPPGIELHPAPIGLSNAKNHITDTRPEGEHIVSCDDDIRRIIQLQPDGTTQTVEDLHHLFLDAFNHCEHERITLWGVSPAANAYFMRRQRRTGLWFCPGGVHGYVNTKAIRLERSAKDDYERTLKHYERDGATLRLRDIAFITDPLRTSPGGLQAELADRRQAEAEAVRELQRQFPSLVQLKPDRDGYPEIALRIKR